MPFAKSVKSTVLPAAMVAAAGLVPTCDHVPPASAPLSWLSKSIEAVIPGEPFAPLEQAVALLGVPAEAGASLTRVFL